MACLKCGSAWVTKKGKDKLSCPECCKQQRCKARKQGRLPKEEERACAICGAQMTIVGSAICSTRYCGQCKQQARRNRKRRQQERVARGEPPSRVVSQQRAARKCVHCEKTLGPKQKKYCDQSCYHAARNAGTQSWDRTNQLEANVRRCGVQISPSRQGLRAVLGGFSGFMSRLRAFQKRIGNLSCLTCHAISRPGSRFCSDKCRSEFEFLTVCARCGCETIAKGLLGSKARLCVECKLQAKREAIRRRNHNVGNNRKRCRKGGGYFNPHVRRTKVFEKDRYRCWICGVRCRRTWQGNHPREATLDHVKPLAKGGDHDWHNVRCACRRCNSLKSDSWGGSQKLLPLA